MNQDNMNNSREWEEILQSLANEEETAGHDSARDKELDDILNEFQAMLNTDTPRTTDNYSGVRTTQRSQRPAPQRSERPVKQSARKIAPQGPELGNPVMNFLNSANVVKGRKSRIGLLVYLWLSLLLSSYLVRALTISGGFFKTGFVLSAFFALTPALLVLLLSTVIPNKKVNKGIVIAYNAIVFALYTSQFVYYKIFSQYFTATSMGNAKQGLGFLGTVFVTVLKNLHIIVLLALPLLFVIFLGKHFFSFRAVKNWRRSAVLAVLVVLYHCVTVLFLPIFGGFKAMTPYDMYHHTYDLVMSAEKLGLGTAFRLDMKWMIFGAPKAAGLEFGEDYNDPYATDPADTTPAESQDPNNPDETGPVETVPAPTELGYNTLNIDFDTLIAGEGDEDIRELHAYFDSCKLTKKNDHTGMFEGCNLIQLTCESLYYLAIDPELTPTLYKMQTEGMNFTNFYTPIWGVSTSDGEYVHMTGTIPEAGVWSFYRTGANENYMPLTMCAQLKNLGYCAYAYHNHDYDYYDRDLSHPNMGYIYKGMGNGLEEMGVTKQWPESDVEMIEATTEEYIHQEPFHAYYMTVSGHREYNFLGGNKMASKHREEVDHLPYSDPVKAYLATEVELDRAMAVLLERLEEAGVAENTVIVLTADHYPYGLTNEEVSELLGHEVDDTFELYRNACIIYKKGMTPETIDWACSSLDVLPTLSNLFGIDFDSRLYMGHDVFSDAAPLIIFQERSWITDKCSYDAYNDEITSFTGEEIPDEYIAYIKRQVANKFTVSARILEEDYWRALFKPDRS